MGEDVLRWEGNRRAQGLDRGGNYCRYPMELRIVRSEVNQCEFTQLRLF
jgi:hypothetical protein